MLRSSRLVHITLRFRIDSDLFKSEISIQKRPYESPSFERLTELFRSGIIQGVVDSSLAAPPVPPEELQFLFQMSLILIVIV